MPPAPSSTTQVSCASTKTRPSVARSSHLSADHSSGPGRRVRSVFWRSTTKNMFVVGTCCSVRFVTPGVSVASSPVLERRSNEQAAVRLTMHDMGAGTGASLLGRSARWD
jgi:hypothetical protein